MTDSAEDEEGSTFAATDTEDEEPEIEEIRSRAHAHDDGLLDQMDWDGLSASPGSPSTPFLPSTPHSPFIGPVSGSPPLHVDEETPLLRRVSFSADAHPRHNLRRPELSRTQHLGTVQSSDEIRRPVLRPVIRRASSGSIAHSTTSQQKIAGMSTFGQTVRAQFLNVYSRLTSSTSCSILSRFCWVLECCRSH